LQRSSDVSDDRVRRVLIGAAILLGCLVLAALYVSPHLERKRSEQRLAAHCRTTGSVVLSYDDGPSPRLTPRLLDLLRDAGVRATFFALGRNVQGNEGLIDRIVSEGHELGCHGQDHHNAWKKPPSTGVDDIRRGYGALEKWLPKDGLFRPPHGKMTLLTRWELARRSAPIGCWTLVSGDTFAERRPAVQVAEDVRRAGGGVVLMHDFEDEPARDDWVIEATRHVLATSREEGLQVRTLGEVMRGMAS
jgi:peptidoglycan/xylan/chitin deacetylase (PgdA/CDA1 family)